MQNTVIMLHKNCNKWQGEFRESLKKPQGEYIINTMLLMCTYHYPMITLVLECTPPQRCFL